MKNSEFDPGCRDCPRLSGFLDQVRLDYPDYHAAPVPPFGSRQPRLVVVGLAPGMHGANATGRPFTGDYAGILLYQTLYEYGFSNRPVAESLNDGLKLRNCRITNAVKCLPPQNKPTGAEIRTCNRYLRRELAGLRGRVVILALGRIAHEAVLRARDRKLRDYPFGHGACHQLDKDRYLLASYHCSRYNTQTRRLTPAMFRAIFDKVHELLAITN
ncbi:MAG: uracil-DNA glycosylase [Gammaproteobacteria bacterium]